MNRAKAWLRTKVIEPGKEYIKNGADPKTLAASAAAGFTNGLCPLLGVSAGLTVVCVFLSRGKLHGPMALLANFVSVPVELALILPYMRVGEWVTNAPHVDLAPVGIKDLVLHSSGDLLKSVGRALLAWVVTWPLLAGGLYLVLAPAFAFLRRKYMRATGSGAGIEDLSDSEAAAAALAAECGALQSTPLLPVVGGASSDGSVGSAGGASRRSSSFNASWREET